MAKEAYHLPLEPTSSGLFGKGLSHLLVRSDKLTVEKRQKALHEVVVCLVKTGKAPAQHKLNHLAQTGSGPKHAKKGQFRKKKRPVKNGGQPFKQGQSDVNAKGYLPIVFSLCSPTGLRSMQAFMSCISRRATESFADNWDCITSDVFLRNVVCHGYIKSDNY